MSGRKAADLRGDQCDQSDAGVCRHAKALPRLRPKSTVHDRALSTDRDPRARSGTRTSARAGEGSGLRGGPTATSKSRSTVCGAEEPDRTAAAALAKTEIRARAVLAGGHGPEPQTAGAVSEKEITPTGSDCNLSERKKEGKLTTPRRKSVQGQSHTQNRLFQHPQPLSLTTQVTCVWDVPNNRELHRGNIGSQLFDLW